MSDNNDRPDKTVFRQPVKRGDGTVVRPVPGGRGSTGETILPHRPSSNYQPPPEYQQPLQAPPVYQQQPQQQAPPNPAYNPSRVPNADIHVGQFATPSGLNPLVNAASILLAVFCTTRVSVSHPNVGGVHQQLIGEIKTFENKAREAGIKPEIVLASRYILCTILDEAVLTTPWGVESGWTQRTLLSTFHNETEGGEKFFMILDRMRHAPAENLNILELMYICISLGYEGKYRVIQRGRDKLEYLRDELFQIIRNHRGEYERSLSPSWQGLGRMRNSLAHYVPMWVIASVLGGVLLLGYSGFRYWLHNSTEHVTKQLDNITERHSVVKRDKPRSELDSL